MNTDFPLYRRGTNEEVTSRDLTDQIAKVLSDIYSLRYNRKITIKFGGDGNGNQVIADDTATN